MPFFRAQQATKPTGVFLGAEHVWVFQSAADTSPLISRYPRPRNWPLLFRQLAADIGPSLLQVVLGQESYQQVAVDKPAVPDNEITQALLWSVKDIVAMPPQNIYLDYFESPLAGSNKLQVVITDKPQLSAMVQAADAEGMSFAGISVEELMPANLFTDASQARLVISHIPGEEVLLTVVRSGELYMHRRIRGFKELDSATAEDLRYGIADNLSLEIQRSMDFFESQLRQPPVASIELLVEGASQALAHAIAVNFNQPVATVNCENVGAKMAELALTELLRGRL